MFSMSPLLGLMVFFPAPLPAFSKPTLCVWKQLQGLEGASRDSKKGWEQSWGTDLGVELPAEKGHTRCQLVALGGALGNRWID